MKVVGVIGSGSGCGKTTLVCALLREIPGLGAVKISPREDATAHVEWGGGPEVKDTARYIASGAKKAARIVAPRAEILSQWPAVLEAMKACRGVIVEGGADSLAGKRDLTIFLVGGRTSGVREERTRRLARGSDVIAAYLPTDSGKWTFEVAIPSHNSSIPANSSAVQVLKRSSGLEEIIEIVRRAVSRT